MTNKSIAMYWVAVDYKANPNHQIVTRRIVWIPDSGNAANYLRSFI